MEQLSNLQEDVVGILVSIALGIIIGFEREYQTKTAGLRTFTLISFGACIFTMLSMRIGLDTGDRIASNIVTGIGFLGAGVIFKSDNRVMGITTATTIWATASLGMAAGSGNFVLAISGVFIVLIVLRLLVPVQRLIDSKNFVRQYKITSLDLSVMDYGLEIMEKHGLKAVIVAQIMDGESLETTWELSGKRPKHDAFVQELLKDPVINHFSY
jgi:putative Mg2+ transporter-C (MgtC) family protein